MDDKQLRDELAAARDRIAELEHRLASDGRLTHDNLGDIVFEYAPGGIAIVTLQGNILAYNREGADMLGYEPSDLIGHDTIEVYGDPNDKKQMQAELDEHHALRNHELLLKHRDGSDVWVNLNARVMDQGGEPTVLVTFTDITQQRKAIENLRVLQDGVEKAVQIRTADLREANEQLGMLHLQLIKRDREREKAQERLRESEEQFRTLFENNHSIMLIIDPESGHIRDANQAAVEYYGYPMEVILNMSMMEINTLSPAEIAKEMQRAKDKELSYFEFKHVLATGAIRDVEVFTGPVVIRGKKYLYSIVHDITARKQAEETLNVYKRIIASTPNHISLIDKQYVYRMVNDAYLETFNKKREDIVDKSLDQLLGKEFFERHSKPHLDRAFAGETIRVVNSLVLPDEGTQYFSVTYHPVSNHDGTSIDYVSIDARNITDTKKDEAALKTFSDRLELATDAGMIGIWEFDIPRSRLIWDDIMLQLYKMDFDQFDGAYDTWRNKLHPDDRAEAEAILRKAIENNTPFDTEFRIIWPNGDTRYIKANALMQTDDEGKVVRVTGVNQDVTDRRKLEEQLRMLASTDPLTGANNRRQFMARGQEEIDRSRRYESGLTMFTLDIDHFKRINDTKGHHVGDEVLKNLVTIMRATLRTTDIFARMGGEEFSAILPETGLEDGVKIAERLRLAVQDSRIMSNNEIVTYAISIGVAELKDSDTLEMLMQNADRAMYKAKNVGRNRVESA